MLLCTFSRGHSRHSGKLDEQYPLVCHLIFIEHNSSFRPEPFFRNNSFFRHTGITSESPWFTHASGIANSAAR